MSDETSLSIIETFDSADLCSPLVQFRLVGDLSSHLGSFDQATLIVELREWNNEPFLVGFRKVIILIFAPGAYYFWNLTVSPST